MEPGSAEWTEDDRFVVGEMTFQALPPNAFSPDGAIKLAEDDFYVAKPRALIERLVTLVEEIRPQHIVELGVYAGGGTVLLAQLARPTRIVAIDRDPVRSAVERVGQYAARSATDVIRIHSGVDQQDRRRIAEIAEAEFGGAPLDLVVDDCSHLYTMTKASFNELFPRLRPGAAYVIEDWTWAHTPLDSEWSDGLFPRRTPLSKLLFEITLAIPGLPGLVDTIAIESQLAIVRRGERAVEASGFDISACSNPRGRRMLAAPREPAQAAPQPNPGPVTRKRRPVDPYALLADLPLLHHWDGEAQVGGLNVEIGERIIDELRRYHDPRVLETGAGATTLLFCCLDPCTLTSIAPDPGLRDRTLAEALDRGISVEGLRFIAEQSETALPRLAAGEERVDVALIDGSHNWPAVFVDFCYINMMMPAGGTLFVDDIQLFSVSQLYLLLCQQEEFEHVALDGKFATFRKLIDARFLPEWNAEPYVAVNSPVRFPPAP